MVRLAPHRQTEILHEERHAGERAGGHGATRLGAGALVAFADHGVDRRVDPLDPFDRRLDQFRR